MRLIACLSGCLRVRWRHVCDGVVGGKVVRFKLSPALARAHRQNRGKSMTEAEAITFVENKRRARALRRARPYLASRP
jgi:hypothetical protein